MAFDQNFIPNDLLPLNIVRPLADETRIVPVTTSGRPIEGYYANPSRDGNPGLVPLVNYPVTVSDSGFVGFSAAAAVQGVAGWVPRVVPPVVPQPVVVSGGLVNPGSGLNSHVPSFGARSHVSDQGSEESGEDWVSGRKVKLMCSFGGKILPRPSDGVLRYVGGQTRIINVRGDISFSELVQKMVDLYGEDVVIKYQLPEEDLDALVSVSCTDDLENMIDEYEKLIKRFSNGSAKLRVFLFSALEVESAGVIELSDLRDNGQKYVEAVNGILDGVGVGVGRINRKGSVASADSTQNSDFSGADGFDSYGYVHGEVSSVSPRENIVPSQQAIFGMPISDPSIYIDASSAPLGVPVVTSGPLPSMPVQRDFGYVPVVVPQQVGFDRQLPGMAFPVSSSYMPVYVDPRHEILNRANYAQQPSQMGFPGHLLGTVSHNFPQQHVATGVTTQPFIPPTHVTTPISSHVNITPNMVSAFNQPQQIRLKQFPAESASGQQVSQLPGNRTSNSYQAQASPAVIGGGYPWHQIPQQEQVAFSEGWVPREQVLVSEKFLKYVDCNMCQKALPHAHSDTIAQERKESPSRNLPDPKLFPYNLQLDDRGRPTNIEQQGTRARLRGYVEPEVGRTQAETIEVHQKVNIPQSYQDNAVQQVVVPTHYQIRHDPLTIRPTHEDTPIVGGVPFFTSDYGSHESPKESPKEDDQECFALYDQLRQITGRMENLHINPADVLPNSLKREDILENRQLKVGERKAYLDTDVSFPHSILDMNEAKQNEMLPCFANEPSYLHNLQQMESYEVVPPPFFCNPGLHPHPMQGVNHMAHGEVSPGIPIFSGVDIVHTTETFLPCGDMQENSESLFSNQDPWNFQQDTPFPPPRPKQIQLKKGALFTRYPSVEKNLTCPELPVSNGGRSITEVRLEDGVQQISGNLDIDCYSEHTQSNRGSAEESIKQELQAVAEGVAASVFQTSINLDFYAHGKSETRTLSQENNDVEIERKNQFEEAKAKLPEKINIGFPILDGIGRLQIIKNRDLEELRELGSGTFGTVYHGKWRGSDIAIKRISDRCFAGKPSDQERMRDDFWNEAIKLADLHHPNVVTFYGVVLDGPGGSVATVTEYMVNGSLRTALQKNSRNLDKRKRLLIAMDVAFGMEYLHEKNIVHFDLKSDNLLVNLRDPHRPICKVGDLGLSKVKCQTLISGGVRGTLPWMAPELLNGSSSLVSEKVDVYSFGIVMWELLTGEEPYADLHYGAIIGGIVSNTLRPPIPESCDPEWRLLMERCWLSEPSQRPNFTDIANELRVMASKSLPKGQMQQPNTKS